MPYEHQTGCHCSRCRRKKVLVIVCASIGVGIVGLVIIMAMLPSTLGTINGIIGSNTNSLFESSPKEPIAVYEHCVENPIKGTKERLDVDCYKTQIPSEAAFDMQSRGTGGLLKSFTFNRPSQLWGTGYGGGEMKVYQYGQNDFELGLTDQVSEKRYHTTLWELPT